MASASILWSDSITKSNMRKNLLTLMSSFCEIKNNLVCSRDLMHQFAGKSVWNEFPIGLK
uniref:Uncharacterized protein n=1 Tax=Rhizophora mucronata TaxID=61149 RepID=A0A2P2IHV7_RHIMU